MADSEEKDRSCEDLSSSTAMFGKRSCIPEGNTPGKKKTKIKRNGKGNTAKRSLFHNNEMNQGDGRKCVNGSWATAELATLVQHICLYWDGAHTDKWPSTKNMKFWNECAISVNKMCSASRTGSSCRTKVTKFLVKEFATLSDAEEFYNIDYVTSATNSKEFVSNSTPAKQTTSEVNECLSPIFSCSAQKAATVSLGDTIQNFISAFQSTMSERLRKQLFQHLFQHLVVNSGGNSFYSFVQHDFLDTSLSAMRVLFDEGKHNLVYHISMCFNREHEKAETRMPIDRMPFGLIDYNVRFFSASSSQKLGIENHYALWLETMLAHFGQKWLCLFRGPFWQYEIQDCSDVSLYSNASQETCSTYVDEISTDAGLESIIGNALRDCSLDLSEYQEPVGEHEISNTFKEHNDITSTAELSEQVASLQILNNANIENIVVDEQSLEVEVLESTSSEHSASTRTHTQTRLNRSHLWTQINDEDRQAIENEQILPECMEEHHNIHPISNKRRTGNPNLYNPIKAKVNVAAIGVRQLQKRIACSGFVKSANIQVKALQDAKASNPNGRWWIKADACDVRDGLRESVRGIWSGDEDLGNGSVDRLHSEYASKCNAFKKLFAKQQSSLSVDDVNTLVDEFVDDTEFLEDGMAMAKEKYEKKLTNCRCSDDLLMKLAWDVVGFEQLLKQANEFKDELNVVVDNLKLGLQNVAVVHLRKLEKDILQYYKDLYSKKRSPASHLLVFMLADELRNVKPYAVPVQFMPIKSITDDQIRQLELEIETSMKTYGMVVVGFTTDGEFNSLRTMGRTRPISIIEVIRNVKAEARKIGGKAILKYFMLNQTGSTTVEHHHAIPLADILWLHDFMKNGQDEPMPIEQALLILRRTLFPFSYNPCPFVEGRKETRAELLMSIMAIYLFRWEVQKLKELPVNHANFSDFLYQPEKYEDTNEYVHHREDHNHVLKRLVNCLREGVIPGIDLRHFRDALHDPKTGLTYESLTGKNKQSVPDCERLISPAVVSFLREKGDVRGANILSIICNWHKAVDGRGLSEEERSSYLADMKNWLLDDWMPWHRYNNDFSTIDVNRPIKGICGLTRELVVALVANLESREIRRVEYQRRQMSAEHPRASSSDDVEGFFSLLHGMLGPVFDLKQFYDESRKLLNEYSKRIDSELPFFYWSGKNERYRDFELPSFNQPSGVGLIERLDKVKVSRRGDPGVFVANRASLPQKGRLTCRATFHKAPIELPPLGN